MARLSSSIVASLILLSARHAPAQGPVTSDFTYQGELRQSGTPVSTAVDLRFRLYDALTGGNQVGPQLAATLTPSSGRFTIDLDFGAVFSGQARWLEVDARPAGGPTYTTLAPRQPLSATPNAAYALAAGSASSAATAANATQLNSQPASYYTNAANLTGTLPGGLLSGNYANALTLSNASNSLSGNGAGLTNVTAVNFTGSLSGDVTGTQSATTVARLQSRPVASTAPTSNQVLKWTGSQWAPGTDTDTLYTAGAGLSLSGTQFSVAPNGITNAMLASDASSLSKVSGGAMSTT